MELIDVRIDKNGKLALGKTSLYGGSFFKPYPTPKIILTEKEAKERGIPITKKTYCKINGIRVPINIKHKTDTKGHKRTH